MSALIQVMREYGDAIRGDWSDFDGRSMKAIVNDWADEIENPTDRDIHYWRLDLNLCPDGNGHWAGFKYGHCTRESCPLSYAEWNPDEP